MSSATILIQSSPSVLQTRCFYSPVRTKEFLASTEGDKLHRASLSKQAVVRFKLTGESDGSISNRSTAAKAGLGRYSGAIHGNMRGKSLRRRSPSQQEDEHQGSDGENPVRTDDGSGISTDSEACKAFVAESIGEDAAAEELSYNRYLLEIGVSPASQQSGESECDSPCEYLQEMHDMQDDMSCTIVSTSLSHAYEEGQVQEGGVVQQLNESNESGELVRGSEGTEVVKIQGAEDAESVSRETAVNSFTETESISVVESAPVAEAVTLNPDYVPEIFSFEKIESKVSVDGEDRIAEFQNAGEVPTVSDGGPVRKKRRKKPKAKAVVEASLKIEEVGDKKFVRASSGGAERPVIPSDKGAKDLQGMNGSVTGKLEPELDFRTNAIKSTSRFTSEAEPAEIDVEASPALAIVVDSSLVVDSSSEDKPLVPTEEKTTLTVLGEVGTKVVETVLETAVQTAAKVVPAEIVETAVQTAAKVVPPEIVETAAQVATKVVELPVVVVEQAAQVGGQVVEQVVDILPDVVTEQVGSVVDQVSDFAEQVSEQVSHVVDQVSDVAEQVASTVNEQVEQVAESVSSTASQVAEQFSSSVDSVTDTASQVVETISAGVDNVTDTASQVVETIAAGVDTVADTASQVVDQVTEFFASDEDDESDGDYEFEAYVTSDLPEFRGRRGLDNFIIKQDDQGVLAILYDFYTYMLKQSLPSFAAAMFAAPILVSALFTLLYLPEFEGLAFDETARDFFAASGGDGMLTMNWKTVFQVFMFSLSLSTGLQPELAPLSPYTLVVANINALVAQLVFVFLSGAVFARLSQPSQPLRCSSVALVSASPAQRRRKENGIKVLMARYVLSGPQPCELVDVKVDLTYKYNTVTRTGSFFRATQSLKLVRPEIAFLTHGMLVRHVIDETSPLYQRTPEMLDKEDAIFCLSVVGLERASMQSVFHVQHYCVVDNHVIWDAEFEDLILINKKNRRVVDHSRLSLWRPC